MNDGYIRLAAAIASQAVADLEHAYKKVRCWQENDKQGKLKSYVEKAVFSQMGKKGASDYRRITFTQDDASAVEFFKDESKCLIGADALGVKTLPKKIVEQRDYITRNRKRLEGFIRIFRAQATKKFKDKQEAEKERTM